LLALDHHEILDAAAIAAYADTQRAAWEAYAADPGTETFAQLEDGQPARLARVALAECADVLGDLTGLHLSVTSDLPLGAGFGSSAAAAVGIVSAGLALAGAEARWSDVGPRVAEVERRQHGSPSGIDAATVFHGGVLSATRDGEDLDSEPLPVRADLLRQFRIVNTGAPAESTGEVVAAVAARRAESTVAFDAILGTMGDTTRRFRELISSERTTAEDLMASVRTYERCLEEIGVVPGPVANLVRDIERRGGAAKISGAGSLSGNTAGCLLVILPDDAELPDGLDEIQARLAAEGVRVEKVE
jgi:mevalonate kinase